MAVLLDTSMTSCQLISDVRKHPRPVCALFEKSHQVISRVVSDRVVEIVNQVRHVGSRNAHPRWGLGIFPVEYLHLI
jgi:hypothetical protein